MEHQVTIERRNIPMKQVFLQKLVIDSLCQQGISLNHRELQRLMGSDRTFAQYCCLAGNDLLPESLLAAVSFALDKADRMEPVALTGQYPWLAAPVWALSMGDVSYFKVAAECEDGKYRNVERIQCEPANTGQSPECREMEQNAAVLSLYPEGEDIMAAGDFEPDSAVRPFLRLYIDNTAILHSLIKELLLHGTFDWRRYAGVRPE